MTSRNPRTIGAESESRRPIAGDWRRSGDEPIGNLAGLFADSESAAVRPIRSVGSFQETVLAAVVSPARCSAVTQRDVARLSR